MAHHLLRPVSSSIDVRLETRSASMPSSQLRTVLLVVTGALLMTGLTISPTGAAPDPDDTCKGVHGEAPPTKDGDEYVIDSVEKLVWLSENFSEEIEAGGGVDWREASFRQTVGVNLENCLWTPIGKEGDGSAYRPFTGIFDGGNNVTRGLKVDEAGSAGLFGLAEGATIKNVRLVDVNVVGTDEVGGLVGRLVGSGGLLVNSSVFGTVSISSDNRVGGLVGVLDAATVSRTTLSGDLTVAALQSPGRRVGGLVGEAMGGAVIDDSSVTGTGSVQGSGRQVGGLVGELSASFINDSFVGNGVQVSSTNSPGRVGGLVGELEGASTAERSSSAARVSGVTEVGGLVGAGSSAAIIRESFATGDVTVTEEAAGGLAGKFSGQITSSFASGAVTGVTNIGGLVGLNMGSIASSYATGIVTGDAGVGGLVGSNDDGTVTVSLWDTTTSRQPLSDGGAGKPTSDMKVFSTFAELTPSWPIVAVWEEFDAVAGKVWGICPALNGGYPFLLWQFTAAQVPVSCGGVAGGTVALGPATPVLTGGSLPTVVAGQGVWQLAGGSQVPLKGSSPGANQVLYSADGIRVTLTGGSGTSVSNGLVANPNGEIVCEVCSDLPVGQVIEVWMFSTPRLVAAHLIGPGECQTFTIPLGAPLDGGGPVSAGAHTLQLALPTASGMQAVNVGVTVGGPVPASVPAGEGVVPTPGWLLGLALLASAGAAMAVRRQVVAG